MVLEYLSLGLYQCEVKANDLVQPTSKTSNKPRSYLLLVVFFTVELQSKQDLVFTVLSSLYYT
jgi:hypothetical protein